jgi:Holliday junction resolvase-like predicted endonuclease
VNLRLLVPPPPRLRLRREKQSPVGVKGELDLVGYHGETLAFVEIRTCSITDDSSALPSLPELSVTRSKQAVLVRAAQRFLADRPHRDCPSRFDFLAIDNIPGQFPVVHLHKTPSAPSCTGRKDRLSGCSSQR